MSKLCWIGQRVFVLSLNFLKCGKRFPTSVTLSWGAQFCDLQTPVHTSKAGELRSFRRFLLQNIPSSKANFSIFSEYYSLGYSSSVGRRHHKFSIHKTIDKGEDQTYHMFWRPGDSLRVQMDSLRSPGTPQAYTTHRPILQAIDAEDRADAVSCANHEYTAHGSICSMLCSRERKSWLAIWTCLYFVTFPAPNPT